jgi:Protein of unknown function (DUF1360)
MSDEPSFWLRFIVGALATWRVTHLLVNEDGPADLVARLRAHIGDSAIGRMMDCFGCLSLWIAIPIAFFVSREIFGLILSWLALSGAALLIERAKSEPLIVERRLDPERGEPKDGMLRSETVSVQRTTDDANATEH